MTRAPALLLLSVVLGCSSGTVAAPSPLTTASVASPTPSPAPAPTATPSPALTQTASIVEAKYGVLAIRTSPEARCDGRILVRRARLGEAPPAELPERAAGTDGVVRWTYSAPRVPARSGTYGVTCRGSLGAANISADFAIPERKLVPTGFRVRVTTEAPPNTNYREDPSLVSLRDSSAARMRSTLAAEWRTATRGLGALEVVDESADIAVFVVAAQSGSVHRLHSDGSEDVIVYVSSETLGPRTPENNVSVALHELAHIWCCNGPGTSEGHWVAKERDPRLYGVDKFGLMTDPVTCERFGSILSCPNRFSDREMRALGFASFPAPAPDPCIVRSLGLRSEYDATLARRSELKAAADAADVRLDALDFQIRLIEVQYPGGGAPGSVVTTHRALVAEYNSLVQTRRTYVSEYDALTARARSLVADINALPCDPT